MDHQILHQLIGMVSPRWAPAVLDALAEGPLRKIDIQRQTSIDHHKTLDDTIARLRAQQLVERASTPDGLLFALTPSGADLLAILRTLAENLDHWRLAHAPTPEPTTQRHLRSVA